MKGFVSIFQLLGRYVRRISVVFHRNFTRRDNQHVRFSLHKQPVRLQILRNFVVHKPHTRKTCFTEPLRRIIEPLRRILSPIVGQLNLFGGKLSTLAQRQKKHVRILSTFAE